MVKFQWHTQQTYATAVGFFGTHYSTSTAVYGTNGASTSNCTTLPPAAGAGNGVVVLNTVQSCACLRKTVTNGGSGSAWVCRRELERVEVLAEVVFNV